uniref:CLASP N-terminal domain-containing protein n=1 Tax=Physcomitrium patens TaxID=3218 RepID=A0A2K1K6E6_PHYPA|nr:hypothetical protein PHYPA_011245 [Physcomitrium patens]
MFGLIGLWKISNGRSNLRNTCYCLVCQNHHSDLQTKASSSGGNQSRLSPRWRCSSKSKSRVPDDVQMGGAVEYPGFLTLFKYFVGLLSAQLSDQRFGIAKQACQLLNLLSKKLQMAFESFAEAFIPVLFKSVVITVVGIAESADHCIMTVSASLRSLECSYLLNLPDDFPLFSILNNFSVGLQILMNCRVARALPQIITCAKHDRNPILRTRCCDYVLLVLEKWGYSSDMHRVPDLYQELIIWCTLDAMAKVWSSARGCYRVYSRFWPDLARRLYLLLDPAVQKLLNDEEGLHRRFVSPRARDVGSNQQNQLRLPTRIPVQSRQASCRGPSHKRSKNVIPGAGNPNASTLMQRESLDMPPKKKLQKMILTNQLKAIDIIPNGGDSIESVVCVPEHSAGGSYREIHASSSAKTMRVTVDLQCVRDSPHMPCLLANFHSDSKNVSSYSNYFSPSATRQALAGLENSQADN